MPSKVEKIKNPALSVIRHDWEGNTLIDDKFVNGNEKEDISFLDVLKWKTRKNPQAKEKALEKFHLLEAFDSSLLNENKPVISWLGHSSFMFRLGSFTFLTDPCYYDIPFFPRLASIPFHPSELAKVDYVLLSHNHRDHADIQSLDEIFTAHPKAKALIPLRSSRLFRHITTEVEEAGWYQPFTTPPGIEVFFMPSRHWTRRNLLDTNDMLWGSFIIKSKETTIYFAGDTGYGDHFEEIHKLFPSIDYALLPIGTFKPRWFMKTRHMSPRDAAKASFVLRAKNVIPMHYGTYDLSDELLGDPIREFKKIESEGNCYGKIHFLALGEKLELK